LGNLVLNRRPQVEHRRGAEHEEHVVVVMDSADLVGQKNSLARRCWKMTS
jgi:hypothetical protein